MATILFVVDGMPAGGMERQILHLLEGLQQRRPFKTALAVLDHGGALEPAAVAVVDRVLRVRRAARFDPGPVLQLIREGRAAGVSLIHAFGWMSGLAGLLAARWMRVPIINGSIRAAPPKLEPWARVSRYCALLSDAIVANSRAGLVSYGLAGDPRARVIRNGVPFARFDGVVAELAAQPTICMVANFSKYKDHEALARAMPRVRTEFPLARLVFVGRDLGTMQSSRRVVDDLGLGEAVQFVTDTTRPETLIAAADVCVLASNIATHGEGTSNAIIEYMALGKPVVATNCGGNDEVIDDGVTGFLVPGNSPGALAQRVIELLRDRERIRRMGEAGRNRVRERFGLPRMVAEYEALYESVLSDRRTRRT